MIKSCFYIAVTLSIIAFVCPVAGRSETPAKSDLKELNRSVKARYDGKTFVVAAPGLMAGEYRRSELGIGRGEAGLVWLHYHASIDPLPTHARTGDFVNQPLSRYNRTDDRTFNEVRSGLNITKLEKGEQVRVVKFYMRSNYVELFLEPLDPAHLRDLDITKASTRSTTLISGNSASRDVSVAGFGLRFLFYFDKEKILEAGDLKTITDEIDKYFLPVDQAKALKAAEQNVEIDPGMPEETVIQRLGQPLRSIRVGTQKILKYKDLSVILKDGKVLEVKVE